MAQSVQKFAQTIVERDFGGVTFAAVSEKAAKRLNVAQSHLRDVLRGERIGLSIILEIAKYEGMSVDEVLGLRPRGLVPKAFHLPNLETCISKDIRGDLGDGAIAFIREMGWPEDWPEEKWMLVLLSAMVEQKRLFNEWMKAIAHFDGC